MSERLNIIKTTLTVFVVRNFYSISIPSLKGAAKTPYPSQPTEFSVPGAYRYKNSNAYKNEDVEPWDEDFTVKAAMKFAVYF